jgi:hypothetical protein
MGGFDPIPDAVPAAQRDVFFTGETAMTATIDRVAGAGLAVALIGTLAAGADRTTGRDR